MNKDYALPDYSAPAGCGVNAAHCGDAMVGFKDVGRERTITATVEVRASAGFCEALNAALDGRRITRAGWNAGGQFVRSQHPDKGSMMTAPYLVLKNAQNGLVPWVPSQGDIFANDWAILPS